MLRLALKQSLIHSKPSPFIYFGIHAQIRDFLYIYSVFFPHYISLTRLQIMKRQFTLETVMVDNSTNIDKNQQLLLKHKKDHNTCRWQSRSWLLVYTKIWRVNRTTPC